MQRALLMLAIALTFGPLVVAGARRSSSSWNDLFEFLVVCWLVEMMAALVGALLIKLLKDARKQEGARRLRGELQVARLAFWSSLLLSVALPCAIAWVWANAFAMLSS